ncbi:hypothetical protein Tsubulata_018996 [Turnera subulata]|uniref:Uncharacterized protein n=1 Tax=Turnera subulata TaxID=218843 RepID=A0A9Q0GIP3_9ROSI|nr:hypothetical protein Tsubulata_018996 [Turnera subulata]
MRNPKAKYQAGTPFPEYERLCNIFGKDHATGVAEINQRREKEKCIAEQQAEQRAERAEQQGNGDGVVDEEPDNVGENATPSNPTTHNPSSVPASDASASAKKGKRTREEEPFEKLVHTMQDFVIDYKEERVEMRETVAGKNHKGPVEEGEGDETDITDALEAVVNELERLSVPIDTVMGAVYRMQVEPKHIKLFWRLRDEAKVVWAEKLASV